MSLDAKFNSQIFRKDNPIILACRRDKAEFMGARIVYDGADYLPGQILVRKVSDGLFYRFSAASGVSVDSPCVLFDQCTVGSQLAESGGLAGVSGSSLVRVVQTGTVYTDNLIEYVAGSKTLLAAKDFVDAGGVKLTRF